MSRADAGWGESCWIVSHRHRFQGAPTPAIPPTMRPLSAPIGGRGRRATAFAALLAPGLPPPGGPAPPRRSGAQGGGRGGTRAMDAASSSCQRWSTRLSPHRSRQSACSSRAWPRERGSWPPMLRSSGKVVSRAFTDWIVGSMSIWGWGFKQHFAYLWHHNG